MRDTPAEEWNVIMRNKTTKATKPILDDEDESKIEEEFRYRPERMQRVAKEKHIVRHSRRQHKSQAPIHEL